MEDLARFAGAMGSCVQRIRNAVSAKHDHTTADGHPGLTFLSFVAAVKTYLGEWIAGVQARLLGIKNVLHFGMSLGSLDMPIRLVDQVRQIALNGCYL